MTPEWERAAQNGDAASLRTQIAGGADVDARDRFGQTAVMLAATHGHAEAVAVLVAAGADLDVRAKLGLTATMLAVVGGHAEVARMLSKAGADLGVTGSGAPGFAGRTASDLAAERGLTELAEELST